MNDGLWVLLVEDDDVAAEAVERSLSLANLLRECAKAVILP
jgi:hypothetical protein